MSHDERKVDVPEGVSGDWSIQRFTVERGMATFRAAMAGRDLPPGIYTRLSCRKGGLFMSDTPAEYRDAAWFIHVAEGSVLISGLGLGMVVKAILKKAEVTHITVLELEADVINLVAPSYPDPRLRVIHADCRTWKADRQFDHAWHDIWPDVSEDDLPEMASITRRYAKAMTAPQRQQVWGRDLVRRSRSRN